MTKKRDKRTKTISYSEHLFKRLQNPKEAAAYLNAALEDEDPRVFLVALKDVAEADKEIRHKLRPLHNSIRTI